MPFQTCKNGYNIKEVDEDIAKLSNELQVWKSRAIKAEGEYIKIKEKENEIKKNGESIALALTAAIERAQQIENSSKNVYKLKIQQISILYDRWEMLLEEIISKYPLLEDSHNIEKMLTDFKRTIENVVNNDFENNSSTQNENNDTMRNLLLKMSKYQKNTNMTKAKLQRQELSMDLKKGQSELNRLDEKTMVKPITNLTLKKDENYETLVDKFLTQDVEENPQYTNFMSKKLFDEYPSVNDSGFNLKEAVNPKDDLDEIMKSFDFFKPDDKKSTN